MSRFPHGDIAKRLAAAVEPGAAEHGSGGMESFWPILAAGLFIVVVIVVFWDRE